MCLRSGGNLGKHKARGDNHYPCNAVRIRKTTHWPLLSRPCLTGDLLSFVEKLFLDNLQGS